jgi:hypothetical protein
MKKNIVLGSILACFLMLMIPNISAVEYNTFINSEPDYDEDELIQAIIDRIEQLQEINPYPKPCWTSDDPDGPFEGGLDDMYDWRDLFVGLIYGIILGLAIKDNEFRDLLESRNIIGMVLWIFDYGLFTLNSAIRFGDAFDIIDPDEDGY